MTPTVKSVLRLSLGIALSIFVVAGLALASGRPAIHAGAAASRPYRQFTVSRAGHRILVRDYPGAGPAIVLMHGFPDSMHLYDRVVPLLRGRRTVTFDFLGWGVSDKPRGYPYTFANQVGDLNAVVTQLGLRRPILVAHDSSGPAAINWALAHRDNLGGLGLLNTFYDLNPDLKPPQAIALWSGLLDLRRTPNGPTGPDYLAPLRAELIRNREFNRQLYFWQLGRFITSAHDRQTVIPRFWREFCCENASFPAFRRRNQDVVSTVLADEAKVAELRTIDAPVRIIWGRNDPYLTVGLANRFAHDFPHTDLHVLNARHYVQIDRPAAVATLLRTLT